MVAPGLKVSRKVIGVFRNSEENGSLHNVSEKWKSRAGMVENCGKWADVVDENL